jgi:uncharacterized protein
MNTYKADVVIVGAGVAGITAAIELLNQNKSVALIDRDLSTEIGGLAKWSFGGMFFVDSPLQRRQGMKDSVDLALRDWLSVAEFTEEDVLPKLWAEKYVNNCTEHIYKWLNKEHKVRFFPIVHWVERGRNTEGNSYPRFHMVWGTGKGLVDNLVKSLYGHKNKAKLTEYYRHKAEEIMVSNGRVVGISGINELTNEPFEAIGENVIIATGGMGGNIEKVRENWYKPWGEPPAVILNGSHIYALGDMHEAVDKIHGTVTHLDWQWHYPGGVRHPRPRHKDHGLSLVPPKSALWLDYSGKRFGPEPLITAYDSRWVVEEICKSKKKYSWQVLNMKIMKKEFAISGSESNEAIRDKNLFKFLKNILLGNMDLVNDMVQNSPDFVTANTIEELVEKMNHLEGTKEVSIDNVKESILNYDQAIDRGHAYHNDPQLARIAHARQYRGDRVRTCNFQKIFDKNALPLVAIRESILSRKTLGGIQTNLESKVMGKPINGLSEPIPGLFAIGEAAGFGGGGLHGKGALEGTFLGGCILTARIAANTINGGLKL